MADRTPRGPFVVLAAGLVALAAGLGSGPALLSGVTDAMDSVGATSDPAPGTTHSAVRP